jgi:hypothetical protein
MVLSSALLRLAGDAVLAQAQKGLHAGKQTKQLPLKQLVLPGEYIVTVSPDADVSSVLRR